MTSATLPVSSLVGANLAWVRTDFGDMAALTADIKKNGIRQPVLVAPDYLALDGARRLVAAAKLRITYVPVVICYTWEQFVQHYKPLEPDAYPMTWLEIRDLIDRVLRPIYQEFRYRKAHETRVFRRATRTSNPEKRGYSYSHFINATAELFDVQPVHMKMLNDNMKRLHTLQETNPQVTKLLIEAIVAMAPDQRRNFSNIRVLKTVLDRCFQLEGTGQQLEAGEMLVAQIAALSNGGPPVRRKKNTLDTNAPVIPLGVVRGFTEMLETLGQQAEEFRNFRPTTAYQIGEMVQFLDRVVQANARLYRLRRRMESALPDQFPGESEEEEPS
jgi:hypothetical protein